MPGRKQKRAEQPPQAVRIIDLAEQQYDVMIDETRRDAFALPKNRPFIARPLRGANSLTSAIKLGYFETYGRPANPTAIAQAIDILEARAEQCSPVPTYLRSAFIEGSLYIDMGDPEGRVIKITREGWSVLKGTRKVVFRRTRATARLPMPARKGDLEQVRRLFGVSPKNWNLIRAWWVMAWMTHFPVPILLLLGENGSGKSYLCKLILNVVDPGSGLSAPPRNIEAWAIMANSARAFGIDNLSLVPDWLSDSLCRGVTGDRHLKRELYKDEDIVIFSFRRALAMTSIDPGALRPDLGERLLPIELSRLKTTIPEEQMDAEIERLTPSVLAGLLDLIVGILGSDIETMDKLPRMADAAMVMSKLDGIVPGANTYQDYIESLDNIHLTVIESDPVGNALLEFMKYRERNVNGDRPDWIGTADELNAALEGWKTAKGWPGSARWLSTRVKRLQQPMRASKQLTIETDHRRGNDRVILIKPFEPQVRRRRRARRR